MQMADEGEFALIAELPREVVRVQRRDEDSPEIV